MELYTLLLTFSTLFIGGIFYTITGFGAAIFLLPVLSFHMSLLKIAAISGSCSLIISLSIFWKFRHDAIWKKVLVVLPFFWTSSYIALKTGPYIRQDFLGILCGIFFICLGLWSLYGNKKSISIPQKNYIALPIICLCGVISSWFSLSGPLLGLYFLAATKEDKFRYIATLQAFTLVGACGNTVSRITTGILTADLIPYLVVGTVAILIGKFIGLRILYRVNVQFIKNVIIISLIIIGIAMIIKNSVMV